VLEVVREGVVEAPVERVWAVVSDMSRAGEWFAFADRIEVLDGAAGVGRRQRMYGHWGKHRSEIDQEITEYDPPHTLAWKHRAERLDGKPAPRFASSTEFRMSLRARDGQTVVLLRSRQQPASLLRGAVMRLFGTREIAQQLQRSLERLASLVTTPSRP
jgi:uncharacterized protein YndB with AHSA1/START domain